MGKQFKQPAMIDTWMVVTFDTSRDAFNLADRFSRKLFDNMTKLGQFPVVYNGPQPFLRM